MKNNTISLLLFISISGISYAQNTLFAIKPKYETVGDFANNGMAAVKENNSNYGYIDKSGKYIIKPKFQFANKFSENGLAGACIGSWDSKKCGFIDKSGNFVIDPKFDDVGSFSLNGLAPVMLGEKWGYIDSSGKFVIKPKFFIAANFANNGLAWVVPFTKSSDLKYGFINKSGDFRIKPKFDYVMTDYPGNNSLPIFSDSGLISVRLKEKWGYINSEGVLLIPAIFDFAWQFSTNGYAFVAIDYKVKVIEVNGSYAFNSIYEFTKEMPNLQFGENGLAPVLINGKYGYINQKGKIVIQPQYQYAEPFSSSGLAAVYVSNKGGYVKFK